MPDSPHTAFKTGNELADYSEAMMLQAAKDWATAELEPMLDAEGYANPAHFDAKGEAERRLIAGYQAMRAATPTAPVQNDDAEYARHTKILRAWGTPTSEWAADTLDELRSRLSPTPDTGLIEALTKCRNKFAEYAELHRAKFSRAESPCEYDDIRHKIDRNLEMVAVCDAALASAAPAQVESKP